MLYALHMGFILYLYCTHSHSSSCDPTTENGDLYTWGKAGPHLGYLLENTKQLRPRKVDAMVYGRVQTVACGNQHTVGESEGALSHVERAGVRSYFLPPFPSLTVTLTIQ